MFKLFFASLIAFPFLDQMLSAGEPKVAGGRKQPNILFILADDLGWSDTTLFGSTNFYETPNIERLAARGMTFTRAYAASPLCSPTRSAILTGLNPARTGLSAPICHLPAVVLEATPGQQAGPSKKSAPVNSVTRLDPKYYTLAEALKDAGYVTGHFGKWHLGATPHSPLENGFDVDIPHWPGPGPAGSYVAPWKFTDFDPATPHEHIEDRMAQEAVAFMETHAGEPFFLNYWMFSVHAPFDGKQDLTEKYRAKVNSNDPQRCPVYGAMVESMDDAVGTLLAALDRLGIADNTMIVFASDNGGNMYDWVVDTVPTSNDPLRGGKATMYEGGVRGPCTIVWPGKVAAESRSDEVIQSCDFYPTILEILNLKPQAGQSFDGISLLPALLGNTLDRQSIFTFFPHSPGVPDWLPPAVSVHHGDWKLIRLFHEGENGQHRWKLYNLRDDIGELHDRSAEQPGRVKELDSLIERFLVDTNAVCPNANPAFDPAKYRAQDEGKAEPHGKPMSAGNAEAKTDATPRAVRGWQPQHDSTLALKDGCLIIDSVGKDPSIRFKFSKPLPAGSLELHLTMASRIKGGAQFFWQETGATAFRKAHSVEFDTHDDESAHEYRVPFKPTRSVKSVRLDPGRTTGTARVSAMKIVDANGVTVYQWKF